MLVFETIIYGKVNRLHMPAQLLAAALAKEAHGGTSVQVALQIPDGTEQAHDEMMRMIGAFIDKHRAELRRLAEQQGGGA